MMIILIHNYIISHNEFILDKGLLKWYLNIYNFHAKLISYSIRISISYIMLISYILLIFNHINSLIIININIILSINTKINKLQLKIH